MNLAIRDGEFLLVVGPNGAGKTTFLRLLSTFAAPSQGRIQWDPLERGVEPGPEAIRQRLGVVSHQPLLYEELTAEENLQFVLRMHNTPNPHDASQQWLARFGLADRAGDRVATFSRGQRQRLALARAFAVRPRLLLLDEPGAGLDAAGHELLVEELRRTKGHAAVLVATHEPDPFRPLADRVLEVRDRTIREWGPTG